MGKARFLTAYHGRFSDLTSIGDSEGFGMVPGTSGWNTVLRAECKL